jgi:hypothetical protein
LRLGYVGLVPVITKVLPSRCSKYQRDPGADLRKDLRVGCVLDLMPGISSPNTTAIPLGGVKSACDHRKCGGQSSNKLLNTYALRCQSMWQWRNHGPALSVTNRIVTLSFGESPRLTTSRRTGFSKLYPVMPAPRITENECPCR